MISKLQSAFRSASTTSKDFYVSLCLTLQLYGCFSLIDKFGFKFVLCAGPSMLPTIDTKDNIVLLDCFTTKFVRDPKVGEIIQCYNPFD